MVGHNAIPVEIRKQIFLPPQHGVDPLSHGEDSPGARRPAESAGDLLDDGASWIGTAGVPCKRCRK